MDFTVNLENLQARRFILLENYQTSSSSHITNYNQTPPARRDQPNNVGIPVVANSSTKFKLVLSEKEDMSQATTTTVRLTDGKLIYVPNLIPQRTYYYEVLAGETPVGKGKFHTDGHLRMIYAPSISNIRDLGGWKTSDGKYIRYGLIYRGGELNGGHVATSADIKRLRTLGIDAEIDLRVDYENGAGKSVFNFTTTANSFYYANGNDCYPESMTSQESYNHWKSEFNLIMTNLRKNKSIYFHCIWGADRTGLLSLLLEGLLGLPKDVSNKNYELTTFSLAGLRQRGTQDSFFNYINSLRGNNLQQKFNTFFVENLGISQADINEFRSIMLTTSLASSIDIIENEQGIKSNSQRSELYDLQGRRFSHSSVLPKGIYIMNGKKILVK
jgi:protein-tyrosine phosphatase